MKATQYGKVKIQGSKTAQPQNSIYKLSWLMVKKYARICILKSKGFTETTAPQISFLKYSFTRSHYYTTAVLLSAF